MRWSIDWPSLFMQ